MKASELTKGQKVKNQYGETRTVLEVIDGLMVRVYEEYNDRYHCTKLFVNGKAIERG